MRNDDNNDDNDIKIIKMIVMLMMTMIMIMTLMMITMMIVKVMIGNDTDEYDHANGIYNHDDKLTRRSSYMITRMVFRPALII